MINSFRAAFALLAFGSSAILEDPIEISCSGFAEASSTTGYVTFLLVNPNSWAVTVYPSCNITALQGASCYVDPTGVVIGGNSINGVQVDYDMGGFKKKTLTLDLGSDGSLDVSVNDFVADPNGSPYGCPL